MKNLFKNRNFLLLWIGLTVSGIGTWIDFVGLNLYFHHIFLSAKSLGIFMMARMLPSILFGSLGGYLADRYPRKNIMIVCDSIRAVLVLGFIFIKNIYFFFLLGITLSALDKIFISSNGAFLPNIVKKEELMEANSIMRMSHSVIMILGSAFGALIVSHLSFYWVFIIDSITFVVSVICVSLILKVKGGEGTGKPQSTAIDEFKAAFLFFKGHSALVFLAVIRFIDALGSGAYNTSLPVFAKSFNLPKGAAYGWLIGVWAAGEFCGSLLVNYISRKTKISPEKLFSLSVLIMAIGMGLTFHFNTLIVALLTIFIGGVCDGVSNVLFYTVLMKETPDELRGKIFGATIALIYTTVAIGMASSGYFLDFYPIQYTTDFSTIIICISVIVGYSLYFLVIRRKKHYNDQGMQKKI